MEKIFWAVLWSNIYLIIIFRQIFDLRWIACYKVCFVFLSETVLTTIVLNYKFLMQN